MHIPIRNRNVLMTGKMITGGRLLNMRLKAAPKTGELLSKEISGVVGGLTNNQQVLTRSDIATLNNNKSGSGFSSLSVMKSKTKRNNVVYKD